MNVYKLSVHDCEWKPLEKTGFEASTRKNELYYRTNAKGENVQYAVCPDCNNPIQIIGLYKKLKNTPKPYAKHCVHSIPGLAEYDREAFEACALAYPRDNLSRNARRPKNARRENQILSVLRNHFDQVAYLFRQQTGIGMSPALAREMLSTYVAAEGYRYQGASLLNTPWVFAYMAHGQNLYGRIIHDPELREAIADSCPGVVFTEQNQLRSDSFLGIRFWFTRHRQSHDAHGDLKESMVLMVSNEDRDIFKKKIPFDYDWFQRLMAQPDEKRPRRAEFCDLAREYLSIEG